MIAPFYITLLLTVIGVSLAWLAPAYWARILIIGFISLLLIFIASPVAVAMILLFVAIYLCLRVARRLGASTAVQKWASWLFFAPLVIPALVSRPDISVFVLGPGYTIPPDVVRLAYIGLSFTAIRIFIAFREEIADGGARPLALAGTLSFYGSFPAGPITGMRPYYRENIADRLSANDVAIAIARIGWGAAKLLILSRMVGGLALGKGGVPDGTLMAWLAMYLGWFALYLDFSGYTDIAISLARLFGVKLPENFRSPFLATSIQDYWQRWHMSLGAFISTYLFKPLVRRLGRPAPAIFAAFLFVGLWHEVSWTYLFWGIGHGAALALHMVFARRYADAAFRQSRWWPIVGWAMTISWISLMSMIANAGSVGAAVNKVAALFGVS